MIIQELGELTRVDLLRHGSKETPYEFIVWRANDDGLGPDRYSYFVTARAMQGISKQLYRTGRFSFRPYQGKLFGWVAEVV